MLKRGLILIGLLVFPVVVSAADAPDGPDYHKWIQEQAAKGNPAGARSGGGAALGNPAEKPFFSDAGGAFQLDYRMQLDYTGLLARLKALLTSPEWFGEHPDAAGFAAMLESAGAFNATQYRESLTIDKDLLRYSIAQDYSGLAPDSYKAKFLAQPNLPFASANYVNSDVLLYFGMHNVPQTALLTFRELAKNPEAFQEGVLGEILDEATGGSVEGTDLAQAVAMMDAMNIEGTVNSLLTGEVALAFYGVSDMAAAMEGDIEPGDIDASLFLGVRDPAAIAGMLSAYGADMGLAARGESGGWQIFGFEGDETVTLALGSDVLLATTNWQSANARMMQRMARLESPAGQYHFHMNLDQLCRMVEPLAAMAEEHHLDIGGLQSGFDAQGWPSIDKLDAGLRYLLDLESQGGCGALDISGYYNNGYRSDFTMKPSVFMYGLYALGRWGGLAAAHEALNEMEQDGSAESNSGYMDEASGAGASAPDEVQVASSDGELILTGSEDELR